MPFIRGVPTVRFNLQSLKEPNTPTPIILYFHYNGGLRLKYSSGEKVAPSGWDFDKQRALTTRKYPQGADINTTLNSLAAHTVAIWRENNRGDIDPKSFSRELSKRMGYISAAPPAAVPSLMDFISDLTLKYDRETSISNYTSFALLRKHLTGFSEETKTPIGFNDITIDFFLSFKKWLFGRNLRINYVARLVKTLRRVMRESFDREYHNNKAFAHFKLSEVQSDEIALSFQDLETLEALELADNPRLDQTRDLFLIGCFTGLRFSDYSRIKAEHLTNEDGVDMVSIVAKKGRKWVKIPLVPALKRILEKYDFNVPTISDVKFNKYLKELCELAGMTETVLLRDTKGGVTTEQEYKRFELVSSHTARRTFATAMINAGVPVRAVSTILGHATEKQTLVYARTTANQHAKSFSKEIERLKADPAAAVLFKK